MLSNRILLILATTMAWGCESATPPTEQSDGPPMQASAGGRVIHQASAGTPDICSDVGDKPGCDANFSLVALQRANGSVTGQWVDRASHVNGGGGIHVAVNCLNVIGNRAWVSGIVTQAGDPSLIGLIATTTVIDNGRSANDAPDQISVTFVDSFGLGLDCNTGPNFDWPLFSPAEGQVIVK
jgi:hypothetical protein